MGWKTLACSFLVILSSLSFGGCERIFGVDSAWDDVSVENLREIEPRAKWFEWYNEMEECITERTGRIVEGDFLDINWYRASGIFHHASREYVGGVWIPPNNIVLTSFNERLVKHEMIHDLLEGGNHKSPSFECSSVSHNFNLAPKEYYTALEKRP